MSAGVTLAEMIQSVRSRANIENQYAFISDSEITGYLNYCLAELYERLCMAGGQEFFRKTASQTTNNTDDTYPLPGDFFRLTSVDAVFATNIYITCQPFMEEERNRYRWYPGWQYNRPVYYRMLGNKIRFIPTPSGTFTVNINYYPIYKKLKGTYDASTGAITEGSASFDGVNGWEEEAIWRAVVYCKQKGEEDASFAQARVEEIAQRIAAMAATRDATGPERVHDVWTNYDQWGI